MLPEIKRQQEMEKHSNASRSPNLSDDPSTSRCYCLRSSVKQEIKRETTMESQEQEGQIIPSILSTAASTSMGNCAQPISVKKETESTSGTQKPLIRRPLTYAAIKGRGPIYKKTPKTPKTPQTPKTPKAPKRSRTSTTTQASKTSTARVTSTPIVTRPPMSPLESGSFRNNVTSPTNSVRSSGRKRPRPEVTAEKDEQDNSVNSVNEAGTPKRRRIAVYCMDLSSPLALLRNRKVTRFVFDRGVEHSAIQLGAGDVPTVNATLEQGNEYETPLDQPPEEAIQIPKSGTINQEDAMPAQVATAPNKEDESVLIVKPNDSTIELNSEVTESTGMPDQPQRKITQTQAYATEDDGDSETTIEVGNMSLSGEFQFQITPSQLNSSDESGKNMFCVIA